MAVKVYELLNEFNVAFTRAVGDKAAEDRVYRSYVTLLLDQHERNGSDAYAVQLAADLLAKRVLHPDRTQNERFRNLIKLSSSFDGRTEARRQRALRIIVGICSAELVEHYGWEKSTHSFLESLISLLQALSGWPEFARCANCALIERHEKSQFESKSDKIGLHPVKSNITDPCSPLRKSDLDNMQKMTQERKSELDVQVTRWAVMCQCLGAVNETHFSLSKDKYGLLIPYKKKRSPHCSACEQEASAKRLKANDFSAKALTIERRTASLRTTVAQSRPLSSIDKVASASIMNKLPKTLQRTAANQQTVVPVSGSPSNGLAQRRSTRSGVVTATDQQTSPAPTSSAQREIEMVSTSSNNADVDHDVVVTGADAVINQDGVITGDDADVDRDAATTDDDADADPNALNDGGDADAEDAHIDTSSEPSFPSNNSTTGDEVSSSSITSIDERESLLSDGQTGIGDRVRSRREPSSRRPDIRSAQKSKKPHSSSAQLASPRTSKSTGQEPAASTRRSTIRRQSSASLCKLCSSACKICFIPSSGHQSAPERLQEVAHDARALRPELKIDYARCGEPTDGDVEVHITTSTAIMSGVHEKLFTKPVLINEDFPDAVDLNSYLAAMSDTYCGLKLPVRIGDDLMPTNIELDEFVERVQDDRREPINALSMDDITKACAPTFTRLPQFMLLPRLISRLKAINGGGALQKQVRETPGDIASCLSFNILASRGAYSGWHVDFPGGTWLRPLFGTKLWLFAPPDARESDFEADGDNWDPAGNSFAVVVDKTVGAIFIPAGWKHEVLSLEPSAMLGGMIIDEQQCPTTLREIFRIGSHPQVSNEPLAYQLPSLIAALRGMVEHRSDWPHKEATLEGLDLVESLKCECEECSSGCPCRLAGRRCLGWCTGHPALPRPHDVCMHETGIEGAANGGSGPDDAHDDDYVE